MMRMVKSGISAILACTISACGNAHKPVSTRSIKDTIAVADTAAPKERERVQYTDAQLMAFMDSIAALPVGPMIDSAWAAADEPFRDRSQINRKITAADMRALKQACMDKYAFIDTATAWRIFGHGVLIDSADLADGLVPLLFYPFDNNKHRFHEFAVSTHRQAWDLDVYFFRDDTLLSKHNIYHRYGLEMEHYKDADGRTVIYYKQNFSSGSGIWWFNYYFYMYHPSGLTPILNEVQNSNLTYPWSYRSMWLEATVIKKRPLTMKVVYNQYLNQDAAVDAIPIVHDSTMITYTWNEETKSMAGNYDQAGLSRQQIQTWSLGDASALFIKTYHSTLRKYTDSTATRSFVMTYLNAVKNYYEEQKMAQ